MARRLALTLPVTGLLVVGSAGTGLPPSVRFLVAIALGVALVWTGWRVAGLLVRDAEPSSRALSACLVAVALVTLPATALGHFGILSSHSLLLAVALVSIGGAVLPDVPLAPPSGERTRGEGLVILAVAGAFAALLLGTAAEMRYAPPGTRAYDDPSYHLSAVATWRTFGDLRMIKFPVGDGSPAFYPIVGELCSFALLAPLDPSDFLARFSDFPFALFSLLALALVARRLGLPAEAAGLAALLYASNPRFREVAFSAGNDHATAFFLLASVAAALELAEHRTQRRAVLLGLSLGLLAGTKYTGFLFVMPLVPLAALSLTGGPPLSAKSRWRLAATGLGVALAVGGYTYARNLLASGNPIFPGKVKLFGRILLPGWGSPGDWSGHPDHALDLGRFLLHRADLFGSLFPWLVLPAAIVVPLVALSRRGEPVLVRLRTAFVLALPWALLVEFRFLMIDHRDVRYVLGGVALAGLSVVWIVDRLPRGFAVAARCAIAVAILLAMLPAGDARARRVMAASGLVVVAIEAARGASRVRLRTLTIAGACVAVPAAALAVPRLLARYERDRLAEWPLARALEERTRNAPATVAFVGSNQPYFYWGNGLQNRVFYVPTFADPAAAWYDGRSGLLFPHQRASRPEWYANLLREKVRWVVVEQVGSELPELGWIDATPERFGMVAREGNGEIYEVKRGDLPEPSFTLNAQSPHLASYLGRGWSVQRDRDGTPGFLPVGEAVLHLPPFERTVRSVHLRLSDVPEPGTATLRTCDKLLVGQFATDGDPDVLLDLPDRIELSCLVFSATGTPRPEGFRIGGTQRFVSRELRARSVSAREWSGSEVELVTGDVRESRRARGYSLGALSSDGSRFDDVQTFDTSDPELAPVASHALASFLGALPPGTVVLGGVADDASNITDEGVLALRRLGCSSDVRNRLRFTHAFIGVVGATPGSIPEWTDARRASVVAGHEPLRIRSLGLVFGADRAGRADPSLLCSVDDPPEGGIVQGSVHVRGWCQERGGKPLAPTVFLVDGRRLAVRQIVRTARPDVAAAIPGMGDVSRAGYEAVLEGEVPPGRHELVVKFEAPDGRYRYYPVRRFVARQ